MTVFVVQQQRTSLSGANAYDISPALKHGELRFVYRSDEHPSLSPTAAQQRADKVLADYGPSDCLLWAGGDPAGLAICVHVLTLARKPITWLRWDRIRDSTGQRKGGYYTQQRITG